jgi:hypothetical protein
VLARPEVEALQVGEPGPGEHVGVERRPEGGAAHVQHLRGGAWDGGAGRPQLLSGDSTCPKVISGFAREICPVPAKGPLAEL